MLFWALWLKMTKNMATKQEIRELRTEIKKDIAELRSEFKSAIREVRQVMFSHISDGRKHE